MMPSAERYAATRELKGLRLADVEETEYIIDL